MNKKGELRRGVMQKGWRKPEGVRERRTLIELVEPYLPEQRSQGNSIHQRYIIW